MEIKFRTGTSKYSATTSVQFGFYNATSAALITGNSEFVKIENAVVGCSLGSDSKVAGAAASYTVKLEPTV